MTVMKYDKVVLVKEFGRLNTVGKMYEIANITDTSFILRDVKTKIACGVIDIKDFEEYFEKFETLELKGWTKWKPIINPKGELFAYYRTNFKKVQVKIAVMNSSTSTFKSEATCNKQYDDFDVEFGIRLAYARCINKYLKSIRLEYNNALNKVQSELRENENNIKRMLVNLEKKNLEKNKESNGEE